MIKLKSSQSTSNGTRRSYFMKKQHSKISWHFPLTLKVIYNTESETELANISVKLQKNSKTMWWSETRLTGYSWKNEIKKISWYSPFKHHAHKTYFCHSLAIVFNGGGFTVRNLVWGGGERVSLWVSRLHFEFQGYILSFQVTLWVSRLHCKF